MKSEKIILPDFLLADLYKDSLVLVDKEIHASEKRNNRQEPASEEEMILVNPVTKKTSDIASNKPLAYLGSNKKQISIIVNDATAIHLDDSLLQILSAILNACKLNLADVAIINMNTQQVNDATVRKELAPTVVLLFGVETATVGLPFSIPDYKVQQFDNCSYVQAASLTKMTGSTTEAKMEKSKLWLCLKDMFNL
jgi:hypothetical protein